MSIISASAIESSLGYQISRSVRLRSSASAYFNRTPASAGNRRVMTFSWWMKLGQAAGSVFGAPGTTNPRMQIYYSGPSDGRFELYQSNGAGSQVCYTLTSSRYRDPSAWYHFVIEIDTTQATSSNRIKWYVNGVQLTAFDTAAYPSQNTDMEWNAAVVHNIGRQPNASAYFDGYLTEINFIDGQALTPSSFGQNNPITGVWEPKQYTGTYGTNGFYLNFSDPSAATAAAIGKDYSGNGNNWTPNNISVTAGATYDSMLDVPTQWADGGNGRGNYATFNPTIAVSTGVGTITNGNLQCVTPTAGASNNYGTIGMASGKWYWEVTPTSISTNNSIVMIGIGNNTQSATEFYSQSGGYAYRGNGERWNNGASASYGSTLAVNDVIGVAFDADARTIEFLRNGSSMGTAYSSIPAGDFFPAICDTGTTVTWTAVANFGQRPFTYTPPTGFKALNTQNLPEPTIKKGGEYFNAVLYTGNNSTTQSINVGLVPDFVWIKSRTSGSGHHSLIDRVRGDVALNSNQTIAEYGVTAFNMNTDGTIDVPYYASDYSMNTSANSYVAWNWKANGAGVTNTAGSITSTVSAGVTQGFSVVTYTGTGANATVGHGLGVAPRMIIVKRRNSTGEWLTYTQMTGNTNFLELNTTAASFASSTAWNNTSPTSSVFSVGTASGCNASGGTYVAYCFAEVPGFSRFGSYTGNGSADGPFVFCGFRPRYLMIKRSNTTGNWALLDTSRSTFNVVSANLYANLSDAESSSARLDILSNGFKLRTTGGDFNGTSGDTYIFAAFAENPFKYALAR